MKTTLKRLLVMTVIASALTLVLAACEPIEEGDLEQPPMEQPME